ncbi:MAG: hypothetical protein ABEI77_05595 [Halorientalis sp.]
MVGITDSGPLTCDNCGESVDPDDAIRSETMGGLDPTKWQTLSCPTCGSRLKTVFVGDES